MHFDLITLIKTVGLFGIFGIVFAESGLLFGFFLPGDSLLFTAGFLASQGFLNFPALLVGSFIAAVVGDNVGYYFGHKFGPKIFNREDSLLFHKHHVTKAQEFYKQHGPKTIIIARFIPFVRTFAPIIAGVANMDKPTFMIFNLIGGFLWAIGLPTLGYFLGSMIPDVDKYLLPIIAVIILASILPGIIHILKEPGPRAKLLKLLSFKK